MTPLIGLLNGNITIAAFNAGREVGESDRHGMVEIRFINYPLDAGIIEIITDRLMLVLDKGMSPPEKEMEA
jgi:hypothetical protein